MSSGDENEDVLPISGHFKGMLDAFLQEMKQVVSRKNVPAWFNDFSKVLNTFANELSGTVIEMEKKYTHLESALAIQKAVTDGLDTDRKKLNDQIHVLEADLEDQLQYSRQTNILIHGCDEENRENTDEKVCNIIQNNLNLTSVTLNEVARTHRLGPKQDGKKRPIIVKFTSHRYKKMVFDKKKMLKGSGTVITENLTKKRYALFNKCVEKYGRDKVWTLDGRIHCLTGIVVNGRSEKIVVTREDNISF